MKATMYMQTEPWKLLFGDACVTPGSLPDPIEDLTLYVDGSPVHIIEIKQADINPTTIVHIAEIDVVVAGDALYNEIHPMLGFGTPAQWQDWLESVDLVERLKPRIIVAGHRRPDGGDYAVERMITRTRCYITDFAATYEVAADANALVSAITAKYPYHGNLWTLQFSALALMMARDGGGSRADITS